ncbi:hypothetical protein KIPB_014342, partial [Kipferlia bialata]
SSHEPRSGVLRRCVEFGPIRPIPLFDSNRMDFDNPHQVIDCGLI